MTYILYWVLAGILGLLVSFVFDVYIYKSCTKQDYCRKDLLISVLCGPLLLMAILIMVVSVFVSELID